MKTTGSLKGILWVTSDLPLTSSIISLPWPKRNDCDYCSEVMVISDGAPWIHSMVERFLPKATHILDLFHVKGNAGKFVQAVKKGKRQKKEFADELCALSDEGKTEELIKTLELYKEQKMPPGVLNFHTYVSNHASCMNYPDYKAKGYFVGSGAVESGNTRLMQNRMKLQGMRWKFSSGQGMLSLKAKYESGKWNEVIQLRQDHCYGKRPERGKLRPSSIPGRFKTTKDLLVHPND